VRRLRSSRLSYLDLSVSGLFKVFTVLQHQNQPSGDDKSENEFNAKSRGVDLNVQDLNAGYLLCRSFINDWWRKYWRIPCRPRASNGSRTCSYGVNGIPGRK
jgi:hypothetical protein